MATADQPSPLRAVVAAPVRLLADRVGPALDGFTRSEEFAALTAIRTRARQEAGRQLERTSRRLFHLVNLPAASDINRLLRQIALVEREVRELRKRLDDEPTTEGGPGGGTPRSR